MAHGAIPPELNRFSHTEVHRQKLTHNQAKPTSYFHYTSQKSHMVGMKRRAQACIYKGKRTCGWVHMSQFNGNL